ncbi:MAG: hypothetical protein LUE61_07750, partial [Clostridiales bacterium]|nr:hypothetical protein [Clostridiales bacterium]
SVIHPLSSVTRFLMIAIGRYDAREQREGLRAAAQTLQELFRSAKEEEKQTSRLTLALGSCGAVFLLVLLL